ncbi:MAG: hypothetical protein AAFQ94_26350 [Bacteroidota bacterium]
MQKYKGKSFEEQMRDSLEGAEMNPPEGIWTAIDGEIANMEASSLRKQMVFYRAIAATLLIIIVSALLIGWQYGNFGNDEYLAKSSDVKNAVNLADGDHPIFLKPELPSPKEYLKQDITGESNIQNQSVDTEQVTGNVSAIANNSIRTDFTKETSLDNALTVKKLSSADAIVAINDQPSDNGKNSFTQNGSASSNSGGLKGIDLSDGSNADISLFGLAANENRKALEENDALFTINPIEISKDVYYQKIPSYDFIPKNLVADNANRNSKSWADFNIRGGVFEPNYQIESVESVATPATGFRFASISPNNFSANRNEVFTDNSDFRGEDLTAGYSYTMSASYGRKLTGRLFMVSGLEYGIYESVASTNRVLTDGAEKRVAVTEQIIADGNIDFQNNNLGLGFENVELNNSFQFASIPVRLGYTLLDKKLSVSVTSGISTGIYLGNRIQDPDRVLDEVRVSRSNNSIYRDVNFSAVGGISIAYSLFDNYLFTIEPVYQRALNSFTRNNSDSC